VKCTNTKLQRNGKQISETETETETETEAEANKITINLKLKKIIWNYMKFK